MFNMSVTNVLFNLDDCMLCFMFSFEGKEGAFMVRDSRQAGVYTVSVFTKAPGYFSLPSDTFNCLL